jgi:pimeloyl-[acyl-carrier protein] methyl ester esterase
VPTLGDDLRCITFRSADGATTSTFVPAAAPGPRTPLFLLPALGLDGRSFAPLAPLAADRRVVFWNPPNALPMSPGLDALAAVAIEHADRAGMPRRFVLGGSSLGAVIALAAALRSPERVAGLVLVGGAASWEELGAPMRWASLLHPFIPRRVYHKAMARILVPGRVSTSSTQAALRTQIERRTKRYAAGVVAALKGAGKFDLRPRLGDVRAPTLIVNSLGDRVAPHAAAKTLATIPGARLATFDGWSHVPYLDEPARFLDALRPFLADVDAGEAA